MAGEAIALRAARSEQRVQTRRPLSTCLQLSAHLALGALLVHLITIISCFSQSGIYVITLSRVGEAVRPTGAGGEPQSSRPFLPNTQSELRSRAPQSRATVSKGEVNRAKEHASRGWHLPRIVPHRGWRHSERIRIKMVKRLTKLCYSVSTWAGQVKSQELSRLDGRRVWPALVDNYRGTK